MPETATLQITMPEMGESVTEGIVLEWHVAEGDFVNEGDTVVEVSTDKVDAEVPAPTSGTITKLVAAVDDEVPVGTPLAEMAPGEGGGSALNPSPVAPDRPPGATRVGAVDCRSQRGQWLGNTGPMSKPRRSRAGWLRRKGSTWVR